MRLLLVEDDPLLADGVQSGLALQGWTVDRVDDCGAAELALASDRFDAVVLDLMLPDGSGLDLLARRRRAGDETPVLILTARDGMGERVLGLDSGADDYVVKPFDLDELAARLRALVRRRSGRGTPLLRWRDMAIDPARRTVSRAGRAVALSRREFALLLALVERPGVILSKSQLEERLYGWNEEVESNAIEVHVHNLRRKLGHAAVETVRGVGYRAAGPGR